MDRLNDFARFSITVFFLVVLSACGGGGGRPSSGVGSSSGPVVIPPPPPPSGSINRSFSLDPVVSYPRDSVHLAAEYLVTSVAIGDVTGDGRPDVVVLTESTEQTSPPDLVSQVIVFPQMPDKSLGPLIKVPYLGHYTWQDTALALADLDNNGVKEILVGHQEGLSIARYQAMTNTLTLSTDPDPHGFASIAVADFDADGKLDVLARPTENDAVLYKGDGTGTLSRNKMIPTPLGPRGKMVARKMNGDDKPDLIVFSGNVWSLQLNDGTGSFGSPVLHDLPRRASDNWPWYAWGADTSDFNGDGRLDVVVSLVSNRPAGIGIYLAKPDGTYSLDQVLESYDIPEPIVLADLDGNGLDDIVTVHGGWYKMGYYLQGPNGFEPETLVSVAISSFPTSHYRNDGLAVGDINSDGCRDVAIADSIYGLLILTGSNCKQ